MRTADDLDAGWDDVPESASTPAARTPVPVSTVVKSRITATPPKPIQSRPPAAASVPPLEPIPTPAPSLPPVTVAPRPRSSSRMPAPPSSLVPTRAGRDEPAATASHGPSTSDDPTLEIGESEEDLDIEGVAEPSAETPEETSHESDTVDVRDEELFVEGESLERANFKT